MKSLKVNKVVEYLSSIDFYHDAFDLEVVGVEGVLKEYGFVEDFSREELEKIKEDLLPLAVRNEINAILGAIQFEVDAMEVV